MSETVQPTAAQGQPHPYGTADPGSGAAHPTHPAGNGAAVSEEWSQQRTLLRPHRREIHAVGVHLEPA